MLEVITTKVARSKVMSAMNRLVQFFFDSIYDPNRDLYHTILAYYVQGTTDRIHRHQKAILAYCPIPALEDRPMYRAMVMGPKAANFLYLMVHGQA